MSSKFVFKKNVKKETTTTANFVDKPVQPTVQLLCTCGTATKSRYYQRRLRQSHQKPSNGPLGPTDFHTKVCVRKECGKRFSICERHPQLGWQAWHQTKHLGRDCTAIMWTHNCKQCVQIKDLGTVLCPECKVGNIKNKHLLAEGS